MMLATISVLVEFWMGPLYYMLYILLFIIINSTSCIACLLSRDLILKIKHLFPAFSLLHAILQEYQYLLSSFSDEVGVKVRNYCLSTLTPRI